MALQTKSLALLIAAVAVSAGLVGYYAATQGPTIFHALAASTTTTNSGTSNNNLWGHPQQNYGPQSFRQRPPGGPAGALWGNQQVTNISSGTAITITSTSGQFIVFGNPSDNGTASGTLTFTVNSKLSSGYVLTLSSGSVTINGATFTISSGTAQMNIFANGIQGQGTASSGSTFTIRASAEGNFSGATTARAMLDFKTGSTEYEVLLSGTITG